MPKELALAADAIGSAPAASPVDEAAFHEFYRRNAGDLWAYLYRLTGNAADADDLLQDACCRLLRAPLPSHSPAELRAYMFRVASNLAVDHWRRAGRRREDPAPVPEVPVTDDPALRHDMERTFACLNLNERVLLWLAYVEGANHDEIARTLGVKPRSVRVLLFRARKKLAALLARAGFSGAGP